MPLLASNLPSGDRPIILTTKHLIRRDTGDRLSILVVQFLLKPRVPCASLPAFLLFSRLSVSAATELTLSCLRFLIFTPKSPPKSPPVCVYVSVFINFHVTAHSLTQSPESLYTNHSHWSSQGVSVILVYENV